MIVGYAYAMEFFIAWYSGNPYEQYVFPQPPGFAQRASAWGPSGGRTGP
jgi:hypothetical protein